MTKPIQWLGDSIEREREFSETGRYHTGRELRRVQLGDMPTDWKPMITIGPGVAEIRVHAENEYRTSTSPNSRKRFTCCTDSPRKRNRPLSATSTWQRNAIKNCRMKGQKNERATKNE